MCCSGKRQKGKTWSSHTSRRFTTTWTGRKEWMRTTRCGRRSGSSSKKNGMVVWRFHDHWHLRKPDGILAGMVKSLGWEKFQSDENPHLFTVPEMTLEKLAADVAKQLNTPVLRVVGNPAMKVTKLALSPGSAGI